MLRIYKRKTVGYKGSVTLLPFPEAWEQSDVTENRLWKSQKGLCLHPGSNIREIYKLPKFRQDCFPIYKAKRCLPLMLLPELRA